MMHRQYTMHKPHAGFSLIEVLVALAVVSIGILGLAGLQHANVKNTHNALLHSQASFLAYEIADFMRSNLQGVQAREYIVITAPAMPADCETNQCTPAEMATYHLGQWFDDLARALPQGSGSIACGGIGTCPAGSNITITINWVEAGVGGEEAMSFATQLQL